MDFAQSGLPQDAKIEKAFLWVKETFIESFGNRADAFISQPVDKALIMAGAFDPPHVPLICANLLMYARSEDHDRVRMDFGDDVGDALEKYLSFPAVCGSWEVTADLLRDRSTADEVRLLYLASTVSVAQNILEIIESDPEAGKDEVVQQQAASCAILGPACGDSSPRLKTAFDTAMAGLRRKLPVLQSFAALSP